MDDETRRQIMEVNAEVMAVQALLFGVFAALNRRGIGADIMAEAFEMADNTAIASASVDATKPIGARVLGILEGMRKAYL